ncbi:glutaryl-7-ACA acylase precursor [Acidisarcina polymorpha]|uniref:Glutaryl-7-ACA acylase n=1 Tax=Acidisarcina polymorpha TaxID=2211140 RepID=A0A2Z5G158_9BACT|nr:glutaryl-7-ACA acylase precursor [Acidisarcina polymorpha]
MFGLLKVAFAQPASESSLPSAAQLQALAGEYTDDSEPDTPLSFYEKDGQLVREGPRTFPSELTAVNSTEFSSRDGTGERYQFKLGPSGQASRVTVISGGSPGKEIMRRTGDAVQRDFPPYERQEAIIPMRDGVKLHAIILKPANQHAPLPMLMARTPYGAGETTMASFYADRPELARAQYIYVCEDIRGRFESEGEFLMMRPLADPSDPKAIDESTDAYDTVAWLLVNVPGNNGRVGVIGISYPGFLAMMSGIGPHPAVKAISPQAPMIDVWKGDDFFHNGAFRQTYGYDYALGIESGKENTDVQYGDNVDGYDFFLERGSFAEDVRRAGAQTPSGAILPTWRLFLDHPAYDNVWYLRGVEHHLTAVAVPTLTVGGYYDQEDMWGPQEEYSVLERHDANHQNFLVLGPWQHGSWSSSSRHLGAIQYGEPIGTEYRKQIEASFFARFLKDEPGFDLEDTASFQTGSNKWKRYAHFPPAESTPTKLYLNAGKKLGWQLGSKPTKSSYISDPRNPVPYRHRPIEPTYAEGSHWGQWMTEDQRFVTRRKDVSIWTLAVGNDLTLTGEVIADLFTSTTGSDGDLVVKLIDRYPDDDADPAMRGYELMTNEEIFRERYLNGFDQPAALKPGEVREVKYSLHAVDHVFKKGHTIMVEVQSTWFPLYDRNPQTFVPNIMKADPGDYKKAKVTIVSDLSHPSGLILPVVSQ